MKFLENWNVITLGIVIAIIAFLICMVKAHCLVEPFDAEIAKESIIHNIEQERQNELDRAQDRVERGEGTSSDYETVQYDYDRSHA